MKKFCVNLLAILLFTAFIMACASVEVDEGIDLDIYPDSDFPIESSDAIILNAELKLDSSISLDIEDIAVDESIAPSPLFANNAEENNEETEDFEIANVRLVKYNGPGGDVIIPEGIKVIAEGAFSDCSDISSISIPDSVTNIEDRAFEGCSGLVDINIPESVTTIGECAFYGCSSLSSISIPDSVTTLGAGAFVYCRRLTSISLPNTITSLAGNNLCGMFEGCWSLTDIVIPNSIRKIGKRAFRACTKLTNIQIPDSVYSIGDGAFYNCTRLNSIELSKNISSIKDNTFGGCTGLTSITLPDNVSEIGFDAFSGCSSLENVIIGKGPVYNDDVGYENYIYDQAFEDCTNLVSVTILNSNMGISNSAFSGCPTTIVFYTPCESITTKTIESMGYSVVKSDHSPCTDPAVASTCTETGLTEGSHCSVCNTIIKAQATIPATGHTPVTDPSVTPTCTETGLTEGSHCSACGKVIKAQQTVPAKGHITETDKAVAPTCTKTGLTEGSHCSVCNAIIKAQETIPATGHTPVTDPAVAPTCTKIGLTEGSHCSVCGETIKAQKTIPAKGHNVVTDRAVPPTCTEAGLTEGSHCSVCGITIKAQQTVPAKGHTPVTDKAVAPTLKKTGLTEGSHCSVCGKILVKQKKVAKLISIKKCAITGIKDAVYTGKSIKPAPVVKYNGKKLVKGTDYTVKYANNKAVGKATVTITGVGKYGESVSKTFKINPKAVALAGLTAGKQQLTVKWKKGTGITGYEVQYSLKKSFAGAKKVAVKKTAVKTVLKKLTTGKTYYVRVRAYKTVSGKKYYSAWSKAKSAKVK